MALGDQENTLTQNIIETPADDPVIRIQRSFAAPRALIWRCYTEPAHMAHFWGPRNAKSRSRLELRRGGVWVTEWTYDTGGTFSYSSVYTEIAPPIRIAYRDAPDGWPGGLDGLPPATLVTTIELAEADNQTTVLVTVRCPTLAERDGIVQRGFALMVSTGNDRLAEYLPTLQ